MDRFRKGTGGSVVQGYLALQKQRPPKTLQQEYAYRGTSLIRNTQPPRITIVA